MAAADEPIAPHLVPIAAPGVPRELREEEGLTNALKHAGRAKVNVLLHYLPSNLEIEIVDDGHATQRGGGGRHGLPGLRERVAVFGGRFEAGSQPDGGWRIRASFPTTP